MLKSFFDSRFLKSLQRILHLTPAVDDGLLFGFYKSRALFEFTKFTEWEMDIDVGQEMLVAYRDIDSEKKKDDNNSSSGGGSSSSVAADAAAAAASASTTSASHDDDNDQQAKISPSTHSINNNIASTTTTTTTFASPSLLPSKTTPASSSSTSNSLSASRTPTLPPPEPSDTLERWGSIDEDLLGDGNDDIKGSNNYVSSVAAAAEIAKRDDIEMKLFLEPDPNIFASQLREFVEYQKVYGEGWITVVAMRVMARRNIQKTSGADEARWKIGVQMYDLGLVPAQYVQKI